MSLLVLENGPFFDGEEWINDGTLLIEDDRILEVSKEAGNHGTISNRIDLHGDTLVPGFVDLQVNGGGGSLFNNEQTVNSLRCIGSAHRRFGTTTFMPTLMSDDIEAMRRAVSAVAQAIAEGVPGVTGLHFEGPSLSRRYGGVHDPRYFRTVDEDMFDVLTSLTVGKTLVTLAPECVSRTMLERLIQAGVIVWAGHSGATYKQTQLSIEGGLSGFSHLFNAMSPLTSREPGVVGAALEADHCWASVIVDGHHVHVAAVALAEKLKPQGKLVLITDAMSTVGTSHQSFRLGSALVRIKGSKCVTENGTLAGSTLTMICAVKNAIELVGLERSQAIRMASLYPAKAIGIASDVGRIRAGYRANLISINSDMEVNRSWIDGQVREYT